jgi:hypothetical protein
MISDSQTRYGSGCAPGKARQGRMRRFLSYQDNKSSDFGSGHVSVANSVLTFRFGEDTLCLMFIPRAIADIVDQVARRTVGKDWNIYATMLEHWQEIVGADYARVTTPVKISFPLQSNERLRSNGTLNIRLPKGLAMEFSFQTETIRQRINVYFGFNAVDRIILEPAFVPIPDAPPAPTEPDPEALAKIHESAKNIENEELRTALENFGEALVTGKGSKGD